MWKKAAIFSRSCDIFCEKKVSHFSWMSWDVICGVKVNVGCRLAHFTGCGGLQGGVRGVKKVNIFSCHETYFVEKKSVIWMSCDVL